VTIFDAGATSDLCAVQQMLRARCMSCHTNPPVGGAPMPLVGYADLIAPSRSNPARTAAEMALARMQDPVRPMPPAPSPRATSGEIAVLANWITAGSPAACTSPPPEGGAGGPAVGPDASDAGPVVPPTVCTSNRRWTGGNEGSSSMHPGVACIACHARGEEEAPRFSIAGTVYPTLREPNDCNGVNGAGVQVVITGADGRTLTLQVNAAGNFSSTAAVSTPFRAKVVSAGVERVMTAAQTSGDCNGCHAEPPANGAPGRIMAP
jgi:hypothetical protein